MHAHVRLMPLNSEPAAAVLDRGVVARLPCASDAAQDSVDLSDACEEGEASAAELAHSRKYLRLVIAFLRQLL